MPKARKAMKQNDLVSNLSEQWLSNTSEQNAIALSIFEIENIELFDNPDHVLMLSVSAARRLLRRETDYITIQSPNRIIISSFSSFLKHTHHQVRIHDLIKQVELFSKRGKNETLKVSGGFAVFNYQQQQESGIFDLYHLASKHLQQALKTGNTVKTQKGAHVPTLTEIPPLADMPIQQGEQRKDRRSLSMPPSSWIKRKIAN